MNIWTQKSIELAAQSNYLDQLYRIYPMSVNLRREIPHGVQQQIETNLASKNGIELLKILLKQEVFPIKDSYVAYLKRDATAIERNPATVGRLSGMLIEMGLTEILEKTSAPKETNRQIGPMFKRWIDSGALGVPVVSDADEFLQYQGNIIFNGSDVAMKKFASDYLGYKHDKGLDFIGKFNNVFVVAEAKFLTDFGGHQNAQFNDAIATMRSKFQKTLFKVVPIAILDGVLYIQSKNKMFSSLYQFAEHETIVSAVLLRDYLYSL